MHATTILNFHGIGTPQRELEPGEAPLWLESAHFEEILDVATTAEASVELTFDDGNASDVEIALPNLLARGLTARFFVLAGRLEDDGSLSSDDVRMLRDEGMRIGSHGMEHRPWRGLDDRALDAELVDARRVLSSVISGPVEEAACPRGSYDRRVIRKLRDHGYARVFTSDGGRTSAGGWLQARHSLSASDSPSDIAHLIERGEAARSAAIRRVKKAAKRVR